MRRIQIIGLLLLFVQQINAQDFEKGIGIRSGFTSGIYIEKSSSNLSINRLMLSNRDKGLQISALKLFQFFNLEYFPRQVSFYYGYGAHLGFTSWQQFYYNTSRGTFWKLRAAPVFGLDGIVGLSYDSFKAPLSFTIDVKPYFDFWGQNYFEVNPFDVALSVTYHF